MKKGQIEEAYTIRTISNWLLQLLQSAVEDSLKGLNFVFSNHFVLTIYWMAVWWNLNVGRGSNWDIVTLVNYLRKVRRRWPFLIKSVKSHERDDFSYPLYNVVVVVVSCRYFIYCPAWCFECVWLKGIRWWEVSAIWTTATEGVKWPTFLCLQLVVFPSLVSARLFSRIL